MNIFFSGILSISMLTGIASIPSKTTYITDEPNEEVIIIKKETWSEDELIQYVKSEAIKEGVDENVAISILNCEAPWKRNELGDRYYDINDSQSNLRYNEGQIRRNPDWGGVGEREKSFGPWQYHLPAHPNINIAIASSVEESTKIAMQDLKTNPKKWTCYK